MPEYFGLDLESIRYMTPPDQTTVPVIHEYLRLQFGQLHLSKTHLNIPKICQRSNTSLLRPESTKQYNLVSKHFTPRNDIIPLIYDKQVLLECLHTKDSIAYGTIRVHNCTFEKTVLVHLTIDDWQTTTNIKATHSMNYPHDNTDTFVFQVVLPKYFNENTITSSTPKRLLFAICLQAMNQEFWDNNQGWNYVLDILEKR